MWTCVVCGYVWGVDVCGHVWCVVCVCSGRVGGYGEYGRVWDVSMWVCMGSRCVWVCACGRE